MPVVPPGLMISKDVGKKYVVVLTKREETTTSGWIYPFWTASLILPIYPSSNLSFKLETSIFEPPPLKKYKYILCQLKLFSGFLSIEYSFSPSYKTLKLDGFSALVYIRLSSLLNGVKQIP